MKNSKSMAGISAVLSCLLLLSACGSINGTESFPAPTYSGDARTFSSGFEAVQDFQNFYIISDSEAADYGSAHQLTGIDGSVIPPEGTSMHKAYILSQNDSDNESSSGYKPHRAYPTVQLQHVSGGIYRTPALISLYVYLDMPLTDQTPGLTDDWFSFITLSPDDSDYWRRTVLANVGPDQILRLMHVPTQGESQYLFQKTDLAFPHGEWVRLDIYIDFSSEAGEAMLWQNGTLVSSAEVLGGNGGLAQAHFGLYASARIPSGVIYNDKLRIIEVTDIQQALQLVSAAY